MTYQKFKNAIDAREHFLKLGDEAIERFADFFDNPHRELVNRLTFELIEDDQHFYFAAAYAAARFPDRDSVWGTVRPAEVLIYGLYLKERGGDIDALEDIIWHARRTSSIEMMDLQGWTTEDSEKFQRQIIQCVEVHKKTPINPTKNILCVHKQHGDDLLSLLFSHIPKNLLTFKLLDPAKWHEPQDELLSLFHHCFKHNMPDIDATFEDMMISPQEKYDFMQTDEFLEIVQKAMNGPLMKALRMEVRDMENGDKMARSRMLQMFSQKQSVVNLLSNMALPAVKQRDMPVRGEVDTPYGEILDLTDPTSKSKGTELVHKPE